MSWDIIQGLVPDYPEKVDLSSYYESWMGYSNKEIHIVATRYNSRVFLFRSKGGISHVLEMLSENNRIGHFYQENARYRHLFEAEFMETLL